MEIVCISLVSLSVGDFFAAMVDQHLEVFQGVSVAIRMPDGRRVEI